MYTSMTPIHVVEEVEDNNSYAYIFITIIIINFSGINNRYACVHDM